MWTLYPDVITTRRSRLHHVLDETDSPKWSGKLLSGALEYIYENGNPDFKIEAEGFVWRVTIRPEID